MWSCLNGTPGATTRCRCRTNDGGPAPSPGCACPGTRPWPISAPAPGGTLSSCSRRCPGGGCWPSTDRGRCSRSCATGWPGSWTGSRCWRPICGSRCRPPRRWTRCSAWPPCTGCPTTRRCSGRSPGYSGPGASSRPRRAARGTSTRSGPSWLSWAPTTATTSGTSPGRGRLTSAWPPPASPASRSAWCRTRPASNRPTSSRRSWPPSSWVRTCAICRPPSARPFVRAVAARLDEPVVNYVRLQIRATRGGGPTARV